MLEDVKKGIETLRNLGKFIFISGDITGAVLTGTGDLPRYFIAAASAGIESLKYALNNNPGVTEPLYQILLNRSGDIAILTWIGASAAWTIYKVLK